MAQVNVIIGGRTYRMACEDGQESHLSELAERVDRSIGQLRDRFGDIGEQRLSVMAAITFADQAAEADDAQRRAREARLAEAIAAVARRIEAVARRIGGEGVA